MNNKYETNDLMIDVVIVGAGLAGIMTSYELLKNNPRLKVLIVEKTNNLGGALITTGGVFMAHTSSVHKRDHVDTTLDILKEHLALSSKKELDSKLIDNIFIKAPYVLDLFIDNGLNIYKHSLSNAINNNINSYWVKDAGKGFVEFIKNFVINNNIDIRYDTKLTDLIYDNNEVKGIVVQSNNQEYNIFAHKVVLACGGFIHNSKLVLKYNSNIKDNRLVTAPNFMTGDAFSIVSKLDVAVTGDGTMGGLKTENNRAPIPAKVIVNELGERFTNEKYATYWIQRDLLDHNSLFAYFINDSSYDTSSLDNNAFVKYDSLAELASCNKIPLDKLEQSIKQINIELKAPYYISKTVYTSFGALTALKTNSNLQLVDNSGKPIANLYGAGDIVVSNAFTTRYPGGGFGISFAASSGAFLGEYLASNTLGDN